MSKKKKVSYFYDPDIGQFYYGQGHPMKPHRIRLTHSLVLHYGLHKHMQVFRPTPATKEDMMKFHTEDYIDFLHHVTPDKEDECSRQIRQFSLVADCPVFDGMYKFSQISAGGSLGGAVQLNYGLSDCVINWAGGLHHAKKSEGSGFCYVNDIVLAILELLKYTHRVLYIDIDVHHGDGVEEAFLTTDRVMTVSFHKFGDKFFPGTGDVANVGYGDGKYYTVNVPLKNGITDESYNGLFCPLLAAIMERFQPGAIVFQCGADSLAGDRLGLFNLSIKGHARCLEFMMSFNVPLLVLGGGGYKQSNVARCWTYETGVVTGQELSHNLPANEYLEYFGPDYCLHIPTQPDRQDLNQKEHLDKMKRQLLEGLRHIHPVGAAFHQRPPDAIDPENLHPVDMQQSLGLKV